MALLFSSNSHSETFTISAVSSGYELTYMNPHLCCSRTIDNPFPPPYLERFSMAGQQKTGDLRRGLGPASKRRQEITIFRLHGAGFFVTTVL